MSTYSYKVIRKLNVIATGPEILHMAFVLFINNTQKMVCMIKIRILEMKKELAKRGFM